MKEYNPILGALFSGKGGEGGYNAGFRQSRLAALYQGDDPEKQALAAKQLAAVDPETAGKWQEQQAAIRQEGLKRKATMIAAAPADQRAPLYSAVLPEIRKDWADAPDVYTPELDSMVQAWAQSVGGGGSQNTGVQSTFISGGKLNYLTRDGRAVDTGKTVDDRYTPIIDPVTGEVKGYGRNSNQLVATGTGGASQDVADPMTPVYDRINYTVKAMKEAGLPVEQINAWADNAFASAQKELSANGVTVQGSAQPPTQARVSVKPTAAGAPKTAVAYDKDGNMVVVDTSKVGPVAGAVRPGSQLSAKDRQKIADSARKEKAALDASNQQTDDTVRIIDDLTGSDLSGTVGTFGFLSNIPGTSFADKKAKITTLTARAAFGALQEMRQNSPTGGALGGIAVQELILLQNAQTQLETAQSPEAFKAALVEFKKALLQTKERLNRTYAEHYKNAVQGSAPQDNSDDELVNKYLD